VTLPRGFKANAEREAARLRSEMGLHEHDRVTAQQLADHVEVRLVSGDQLVDIERLHELERLQAYSFSAATFDISGKKIIVTNPIRSAGRLASDIAHEVSHIILEHKLSEVRELAGMPFRTCEPDEEEQATSLGGTLLLPRPLLMRAARERMTPETIAEEYGTTVELARWRYNTTGVTRQVAAARRNR
jgi:Zn-dependent peptidase ImmA (M78 family)